MRVISGNNAVVPCTVKDNVVERHLGSKPGFKYALSIHRPERLRKRVIGRELGAQLHHIVVCGKLYHAVPALRKLRIVVAEKFPVYLKLYAAVRECAPGEALRIVINEQVQRFRIHAAKLEALARVAARFVLKVEQVVLGQNDILLTSF